MSEGLDAIQRELEKGNPIMVGVDHSPGKVHNKDGTEHFLIIYNRGYDEDGEYFLYSESSAQDADSGMNPKRKLYLKKDGTLQTRDNNRTIGSRNYTVTQVRPIPKKRDETK